LAQSDLLTDSQVSLDLKEAKTLSVWYLRANTMLLTEQPK